jgi:hypothetical protein
MVPHAPEHEAPLGRQPHLPPTHAAPYAHWLLNCVADPQAAPVGCTHALFCAVHVNPQRSVVPHTTPVQSGVQQLPPVLQTCPPEHPPQLSEPPHPSPHEPHDLPSAEHVAGVHVPEPEPEPAEPHACVRGLFESLTTCPCTSTP